jgi:hypothetical protein
MKEKHFGYPDDPDAWIVDLTRRLGAGLTGLLALIGAGAVAWIIGRYLDIYDEGGSALRAVTALMLCGFLVIWMAWSAGARRYWFVVLPLLLVVAMARYFSLVWLP